MSAQPRRTGLQVFARRAWTAAYRELHSADEQSALTPEELERFAVVARLVGEDDESERLWERAHQARLAAGDHARAARCAFSSAKAAF